MRIDMQDVEIKARRRARRSQRFAQGARTGTKVMVDKNRKREKYRHRLLDEDRSPEVEG
jgi:hypothetical protein